MGDRGRVDYNSAIDGPSRHLRLEGKVSSSLSFTQEEKTDEERFLLKLGFSKPFIAAMKARASKNSTTIEAELLASGQVREDAYYGALAKVLGLRFVDEIDAASVVDIPGLDSQLLKPSILRVSPPVGSPLTLVVPEARDFATWRGRVKGSDMLGSALAVTTPSALRRATWQAGAARRVDAASDELFDDSPELSARSVLTGGQGFIAGSILVAWLFSLALFPLATLDTSHVVLSLAFCILIVLRALAIKRAPKPKPLAPLADDLNLPVYTVLAALYREKAVVPQLVGSLLRLDWPTSRLDIKLVCEAGDRETIDALEAMDLPRHFEIVEVPDRMPRTKPKALNYGLAGARGEFLVIFDAEDRPHPKQLLEAYRHFKDASPDLACLQAPLIISNAAESWLAALFALEYSGLFRRLLPFLGARHQPMPLGGTSNHFRTDVLKAAGAWDPYNVTEDADLGMRLYRLGYHAEMLTRYTVEDAPTDRAAWLGQRTRWFKGWMQTWLVLMRAPVKLTGELGSRGTIMFHVLVTGMLVSALGHPLILFFIAMTMWSLIFAPHATSFDVGMLCIDWFNLIAAYTIFTQLGWEAMGWNERRRVGIKWRYVPAYWMLMSYAAWKAVIELNRNPYFWNKTPHKPSARLQESGG